MPGCRGCEDRMPRSRAAWNGTFEAESGDVGLMPSARWRGVHFILRAGGRIPVEVVSVEVEVAEMVVEGSSDDVLTASCDVGV